MRLLIINPNTTDSITRIVDRQARATALKDTTITSVTAPWGPASIEGYVDAEVAAGAILETIARAEGTMDGVVIAAYGDPGLFAARELSAVPVVGIGEASMLLACTIAHRFSIVTVQPRSVPMLRDQVQRYGLTSRCASVRTASVSVLATQSDPEATVSLLVEEARLAVTQDGAEAICLGGAPLSAFRHHVEGAVGVPTVDPVGAAVSLIEGIVRVGLRTSRRAAFKAPESKRLDGSSTLLDALQPAYQGPGGV